MASFRGAYDSHTHGDVDAAAAPPDVPNQQSDMTDAFHYFGSDLSLSATGDLLTADGLDESQQRVLRRLLTNQQDYLWQPTYGAGLPSYIGLPLDQAALSALIKSPDVSGSRRVARPRAAGHPAADPQRHLGADHLHQRRAPAQPVLLSFDVTP